MRIAIEGCCHGELDNIYEALVHLQNVNSCKIDLLIICGDFQSIRNLADLDVIACPDKYKSMGTFYRYYNGEKVAPIPTIFIGGNHEASNYLWELYHGGWVCPNIYFLGFGGVVNFGGLRIGGLTGIYNPAHYDKGFFETQPFSNKSCRSIYHVRKYNVYRMAQIRQPLHCFVSHDWPNGIAAYGNVRRLLKLKPYFADEVRTGTLGSDANQFLLKRLKPSYWFSAHLHVKFAAVYPHEPEHPGPESAQPENPDEILISDNEDRDDNTAPDEGASSNKKGEGEESTLDTRPTSSEQQAQPSAPSRRVTRFLALDKCLPRRDFIQVMDIPEVEGSGPYELHYDEEWLAIMRATHEYMSLAYNQKSLPDDATIRAKIDQELQWIKENVSSKPNGLKVPLDFVHTAPKHNPTSQPMRQPEKFEALRPCCNPQTQALCDLIQIPNQINPNGIRSFNRESGGRTAPKLPPPKIQAATTESAKRAPLKLPPPKSNLSANAPGDEASASAQEPSVPDPEPETMDTAQLDQVDESSRTADDVGDADSAAKAVDAPIDDEAASTPPNKKQRLEGIVEDAPSEPVDAHDA